MQTNFVSRSSVGLPFTDTDEVNLLLEDGTILLLEDGENFLV